ncbi:HPr kinase/phosphorylase [Roseibium algae]|uniref:Aldolase n=1 Tax=Roseibium algae TaxID=3123038 RepID=A0ABU8TN08_9HYPH
MVADTIHAGCVVVGPLGILVRGRSGSGKSALADLMIQSARLNGNFAALVSDDRTCLATKGRALIASVPGELAGMLEVRYFAIQATDYEAEAVVRLVVDFVDRQDIERLPEDPLPLVEIQGHLLPLLQVPETDFFSAIRLVRWALIQLFPNSPVYV